MVEDNHSRIYNELAEIRKDIRDIKLRIYALEERANSEEIAVKSTVEKQERLEKEQELELEEERELGLEEERKLESEEEKDSEFKEEKVPVFEEKKMNFEEDIGKKWFGRIGIISIFVGMIFFFKYLFDRNLLSPAGKISIGIIVGLIMLVAGEFFDKRKYEKKYEYQSRALTGGGFAVLYLSIYAAHSLYNLIPEELDLILLGLIVVFAVFFSLRYSSMVIASEAFFLGYVTPFIGSITEYTLIYITMLTIGLAIITQRKNWVTISVGGLIAVYATHYSWFWAHNSLQDFIINALFLSIYFIIFTILAHTIQKQVAEEQISVRDFKSVFHEMPSSYQGILIALMNAAFYYSMLYMAINENYEKFAGLFTIIVALVYFGLSYAMLNRSAKGLFAVYLTLCATFITLAIPLQLDYGWVTIAWAIEGLILLLIGFHYSSSGIRWFGNIVGIITLFKALSVDMLLRPFNIHDPIESSRFFALLLPIITFYVSSIIYFRNRDKTDSESKFWKYYLAGGVLLTTVIFMLELKGEWVTIAWAIEGLILLLVGFRYGLSEIRWFGNIVGIITLFKVLSVDTSLSPFNIYDLLGSSRFFAFLIPIITFYVSSLIYFRNRDKTDSEGKFWKYYFVGSVLLNTLLLMLELKGGLISAAWTIQAIIILIAGFSYRLSFIRMVGIGLFIVTIIKVFILDLAGLETLYRIISFLLLGVILLFASFVYSKYKDKLWLGQ